MPRTHESSPQRSLRDADATGKLWKKGGSWSSQISALTKVQGKQGSDLRKLKRRIVGGGVSASGGLNPRGEYDATGNTSYALLDMVVIRAGSNAGAFYAIQPVPSATGTQPSPTLPDTGNLFWICISNSPPLGQWM